MTATPRFYGPAIVPLLKEHQRALDAAPFKAAATRLSASGITLAVRAMGTDDRRFVEGFLVNYGRPRRTPYAEWQRYQRAHVAKEVAESDVLVAATTVESTDVALGFLQMQRRATAMLYVKLPFRGCGIGMRLIEAAGLSLPIRTVGQPSPSWKKWAAVYGLPWEVA